MTRIENANALRQLAQRGVPDERQSRFTPRLGGWNVNSSRTARLILNGTLALFVICLGGTRNAMAQCSCQSCRLHESSNWYCAPQSTTISAEVTEWGVQSEMICPLHSGLFCSACRCPSTCPSGACDSRGDAGCDSQCDAPDDVTCSASCANAGLAGLDTECRLACNCSLGDQHVGNHVRWRLPGTGPRRRNKLMRKTLVYSLPGQEAVAIACSTNCLDMQGPLIPSHMDTMETHYDENRGVSAVVAPVDDTRALDGMITPVVVWMEQPATPVTLLSSEIQGKPAGDVTVTATEPISVKPKIHWIDRRGIEQAESRSTMKMATGVQPAAPISLSPTPTSADVGPFALPSLINER